MKNLVSVKGGKKFEGIRGRTVEECILAYEMRGNRVKGIIT
jgi:hypothetical protein